MNKLGLLGEVWATALEPLRDQLVDRAVGLEGGERVIELGLEIGLVLAQACAHAIADHHVFSDEFQRSAGSGNDWLQVGAIGQDRVEVAGGQISHGLVGGAERNNGIVAREVFLGISGLDRAALNA